MISSLFGNITNKPTNNNVERIGDNLYTFNLLLNNGSTSIGIKFAAVEELNIIDDLRFFYVYGSFTINYTNDPLEAFESFGAGNTGSKRDASPYVFRGDGRDQLTIDIMPQLKEQKCLQNYASEGDKKKYNLKYDCIIYKYEDITAGKGQKQRKFYFWDRDYQILNDINIDYSTADKKKNNLNTATTSNQTTNVSNSNTDNSIYTGDAIEGVLKKSLVEISKLNFSKGQWDKGQSSILYSSNTNGKAIDDLNYLLSLHISDSSNFNLPCLLRKERYTNKYNLIPLNKFYKSSSGFNFGGISIGGTGIAENFYIGKIDGSSSSLNRSPIGTMNSLMGGYNFSDYNLIDDYTFTKIDSKDLQKYMTTYVVHSNDPRGFFNSDLKENNIQSVEKLYNEVFVKGMGSSSGRSTSNITQNKLRTENRNVQHTYFPESMDSFQRKSKGVNTSILNLFFKNTSISFRARGNTVRQSGSFFTVNRTDGNISNSHDNSMLGKYMITYLRHEFVAGSYYNTIHGIKPYTDKSSNLIESL